MSVPADDFTPEELSLAQRLLDERVRSVSREEYRRMVAANDPRLQQGPVRVPREVVTRLREEVAQEILARRTSPEPKEVEKRRRWPWQRG